MSADVLDLRQGMLDLDPVIEARCEERLKIARTHMAAGFYHWLEAGKQFAAIKQDLGNRHWTPWLRDHNVALSTAKVLVAAAERFDPIGLLSSRIEGDEELAIDFHAMRLLASPDAPDDVAEKAVERAAAGEHITKAKAEEMVAEAKRITAEEKEQQFRDAVEQAQAEETERQKAVIEEATQRLALDKKALKAEIAEIKRRKPDIATLCKDIRRILKRKNLTDDQYRWLAQILEVTISNGKRTYQPVAKEKIIATEENLRIASAVTHAFEVLAGAPPPAALKAATWEVQRDQHRRTGQLIITWLTEYVSLLGEAE